MVWAVVVVVVVLGVGLPAVGWLFTRRPPPLDTTDRGHGEIERWLADRFGLGQRDRTLVLRAVLRGQPVSDPALEAAALGFAGKVAADRFRTLRLARKVGWVYLIIGLACLVGAIVATIVSHGAEGWGPAAVGVPYGGLQVWIGTYHAFRHPNRIRRNAELILRSSPDGDFR